MRNGLCSIRSERRLPQKPLSEHTFAVRCSTAGWDDGRIRESRIHRARKESLNNKVPIARVEYKTYNSLRHMSMLTRSSSIPALVGWTIIRQMQCAMLATPVRIDTTRIYASWDTSTLASAYCLISASAPLERAFTLHRQSSMNLRGWDKHERGPRVKITHEIMLFVGRGSMRMGCPCSSRGGDMSNV